MVHQVRDNPTAHRFEMDTEAGLAFIDYVRVQDGLNLLHAEVPTALKGRGLGAVLVKGAVELIKARGEKLIPSCSFVAAYLQRHREYQDLLLDDGKPLR